MISPSDFYKDDIKEIAKAFNFSNLNLNEVNCESILESKIDKSMRYHHGRKVYEEARVHTSVPIYFIDRIAAKYINAGWKYIYVNITDSSITSFKFSNNEIVGLIDTHILYTAKTIRPYR